VPDLLAPMMQRVGARMKAPYYAPEYIFEHQFVVMVEFVQMTGRTVGDLLDLALSVQALLIATRQGDFNRSVARDLLRAGHIEALLGQPESQWLEAKNQFWNLGSDAGKAEATKDLSALANVAGGLIVIPAKTAGDTGRDVIDEIKSLPLERFSETQLRDTIAQWTFPPLRGLEIDIVDRGEGRAVLVIHVPAHRPEDWPHLVVGEPEAAFSSASVAAYVRDGDKNRALSAPELHALMRRDAERDQAIAGLAVDEASTEGT
jgi:hypothetical protein